MTGIAHGMAAAACAHSRSCLLRWASRTRPRGEFVAQCQVDIDACDIISSSSTAAILRARLPETGDPKCYRRSPVGPKPLSVYRCPPSFCARGPDSNRRAAKVRLFDSTDKRDGSWRCCRPLRDASMHRLRSVMDRSCHHQYRWSTFYRLLNDEERPVEFLLRL